MGTITSKIETAIINAKDSATEARAKVGHTTVDYLVTYSLVDALVNSDARLVVWSDVHAIFAHRYIEVSTEGPLPDEAVEDAALSAVIAELGKRLIDFTVPSSSSATSNAIDLARFAATQAIYRQIRNWR